MQCQKIPQTNKSECSHFCSVETCLKKQASFWILLIQKGIKFLWLKNCRFIKKEAVQAKNYNWSTLSETHRITIHVLFWEGVIFYRILPKYTVQCILNASLANLLAEFHPFIVTGYENNKTHIERPLMSNTTTLLIQVHSSFSLESDCIFLHSLARINILLLFPAQQCSKDGQLPPTMTKDTG